MNRPNFQMIEDQPEKNYMRFVSMYRLDDMIDKLKLLNYEGTLLKEMKMKPLSRYYFLNSTNPGEQFFMFTSLCAFCARKMGKEFEQPEEFMDPTVVVSKIMQILQELGISTDFPANKLMQGAGFVCHYILDSLATQALKVNRPNLGKPEIKADDDIKAEIVENNNEIILEKLEEEQYGLFQSDDELDDDEDIEIDIAGGLNLRENAKIRDLSAKDKNEAKPENSLLTGEMCKLEMERALPRLKIVVKSDLKDWRARWEQMKMCRENINLLSDDTQSHLKKIQHDVTFAMDKIESREKHLNNDLKPMIDQYRNISTEHAQLQTQLKQTRDEIADFEKQYDRMNHEYETIKLQMEQRGATMSDGSPFINLKKAITRIKEEIIQMSLEISVMQHSIDRDIIRENALFSLIRA